MEEDFFSENSEKCMILQKCPRFARTTRRRCADDPSATYKELIWAENKERIWGEANRKKKLGEDTMVTNIVWIA